LSEYLSQIAKEKTDKSLHALTVASCFSSFKQACFALSKRLYQLRFGMPTLLKRGSGSNVTENHWIAHQSFGSDIVTLMSFLFT